MAQVFFHCSNTEGVMMRPYGAPEGDLAEACKHAVHIVRSLIMEPSAEDWRGWVLHASDDLGGELFNVSFASVLGKPH